MLPEGVRKPVEALLQEYIAGGIPVHIGPTWKRKYLYCAVKKGPHELACTPAMQKLIRGEMQKWVWDGFSITLPTSDVVRVFGDKLKLYRIVVPPPRHIDDSTSYLTYQKIPIRLRQVLTTPLPGRLTRN